MPITRRTRLLTAAALVATSILALSACSAADEPAADAAPVAVADATEESVLQQNRLSSASAMIAAQAALAQCEADGLPFVTVAVVDRNGQPQVVLRGDNAAAVSIESAQQKAFTSAVFGAATSDLASRAEGTGATIADLPGTLFLAGGVPVTVDGNSIAGVGVGGAPDGMADQACAAAGVAAISEESGS